MNPQRILVFQTAFLGDVILTLPMIHALRLHFPGSAIDVVTTPRAAELLYDHPDIGEVIRFDKRNTQKGIRGILELKRNLRQRKYDIVVVPHRSFRTSLVIGLSRIPIRIGYSNSAGNFFFTHRAKYIPEIHEIERNNSMLSLLGISVSGKVLPSLFPSPKDIDVVRALLDEREIFQRDSLIAIAPGSVWNTKRWPLERFAELSLMLAHKGFDVVIIGGKEDTELGSAISEIAKHTHIHNVTGRLTLLQSAELIRRCKVLVTNDSAPLHIGVAMRTPVVSIFGATVPEFGFGPYGENDVVIETQGLECRPCAIHGGETCPIKTFVCMKNIETARVYSGIIKRISAERV